MTQIIVTLEAPDIIALEKNGDKESIARVGKSLHYHYFLNH
jgi:phospholipid-translocating ATPase